jgi:hypothetical protein
MQHMKDNVVGQQAECHSIVAPHVAHNDAANQTTAYKNKARDVFLVCNESKRNQTGTSYLRPNFGRTHPRVLLLEGLVRSMLLENDSGSDAS